MSSLGASPAGTPSAAELPRALPAWVYNNADLQRLELERILLPSWQIVCHVNSIPDPGDFVTLDVGPESVVVLRDRDGGIKAFHNVCRHRGARLLDAAGNCPGPITCPYHGWSYRHDGTLVGVPMRERLPGIDRDEFSLNPVRVDVAFSFVFVALRGDPPPVARVWGPLIEEFAPYRFAEMVQLGPISCDIWEVDWKIAIDNYLESYHVPIGHPGLYRMFTPDYDDQSSVATVARGVSWLRKQESSVWSERMYQRLVGRIVTHLPDAQRDSWRFYSALPNLGIDVYPEQMDFFQVLPAGPGRCVIRSALFGLPDARPRCARCASCPIASTAKSTTRIAGSASGFNAVSHRAATHRGRSRNSSAGCCSSTICCATGSPKSSCRTRRRASPRSAASPRSSLASDPARSLPRG